MKAWLMDGFSGADKMRLAEVADPIPAHGEVLLRVNYAALNPADRYLAHEEYPAKPPLPHILGRDGSGTIVSSGPGVEGNPAGQKRAILRGELGVTRWEHLRSLSPRRRSRLSKYRTAGAMLRPAAHHSFTLPRFRPSRNGMTYRSRLSS